MTRLRYAMVTTAAVIGIAVSAVVPTPLKLVWNVSASVPIGLYGIAPADRLDVTDLVAVMPPEPLAAFMVERGYVGPDVPLLKRVMALPGQRVCRHSRAVTIDAVPLGEARDRDSRGRDLPVWQGCRRVANGEVFLMNPEARDSLDGRYFGPLPASAVIGRATPLYTDEDGDGRFVWRAPTR
ncbi:S26 family signal peptidase [Mesorhizobium australicum]|uniref:Conjugative transfer signal peptidase TraF n=1 Tax=Mesorhizobium australicum TaxID=536018 RepID=A0A1X7MU72_9HYPH|nr:S26 family signal peptidase [Mesorhizobium australicum]SMH27878.1 conjugative transfer signal peptidase TraF [Mesorhizobium australicum]